MRLKMKKVGAFYDGGESLFRVWAPEKERMDLLIENSDTPLLPLSKDQEGYWEIRVNASPGTKYWYRIDGQGPYPDPASMSQPCVHAASSVYDQKAFSWTDTAWKGIAMQNIILYEIHTGCFTSQHNFEGIRGRLEYLKNLGVNTIELMPVASFPGERNWGYDAVYPFAVQESYGGPDELKLLVEECHRKGIAVILDVVYNHVGPDGNYMDFFGSYFTEKYKSFWGRSMNLDGPWSDGVRSFIIQNALMWLDDFHIDGLRLDAVHAMMDNSAKHLVQELKENVMELESRTGLKKLLIAEIDLNDTRYIKEFGEGGYGLDGQWADEFHHALHALLTGEKMGYYEDFGQTENLVKSLTDTYVYDGNYSVHRKRRFGTSAKPFPADRFVVFTQNHDQTGNRKNGERLSSLVSLDGLKLASAFMLLSPYIPLLFMGEEYGEQHPFLYFVDHDIEEIAENIRNGRKKEFAHFHTEGQAPDPLLEESFLNSCLSWDYFNDRSRILLRWYQYLIHFRKTRKAMKGRLRQDFNAFSPAEKLIILERNYERDQIRIAFNFSNRPLPIPGATGRKINRILDSHAAEWNEITQPKVVVPISEKEITVQPEGVFIYELLSV